MEREQIIRMAREAGVKITAFINYDYGEDVAVFYMEDLHRFAALVAAAEREACAKVCETQSARWHTDQRDVYVAQECAAAIRARGNT